MEILWVKGSTNINTSLLYITNACWQNLKTSVLPDAVLVSFHWIKVKNVETKRSAWERQAPSRTSLCLVPNTQCDFARKKPKKTQLQDINIWKPGRFLQASDLTSIISLVPVIAKCLQENLSKSDFLPVSKTQLSLKPIYMEASAFAKKAPKLSNNYFCTMADRKSIFVTSQIFTRLLRSRQQISNPVSSIIHVMILWF